MIDEVERQIQALVSLGGHEADRREHDRALAFLLAHADEAHPRLLALLDPQAGYIPVAAVNAIPLFGREDAVPLLEKLISEGEELISISAGQALGRHSHPAALEALLRGLDHSRDETKVAAVDGLMTRGDTSACKALRKMLDHPSYEVRYHVVKAAGSLGCLNSETLRQIATNDTEQDIRELASSLMGPRN